MKILINALGIQDSGGITVLDKLLQECLEKNFYYLIICNENSNINKLRVQYNIYKNFYFLSVKSKGFIHRLYFENIVFRRLIKVYNIDLVYNFSGTSQFFLKVSQLVKVHNLLFYSKKIDKVYFERKKYFKWLKQIFFKKIIFHTMLKQSKYIEVQSNHVKEYISDFIDIKNKDFFIKSDIVIDDKIFLKPKNYDFSKKLRFLYVVGPHFEYIHKNFDEFVKTMLLLQEQNFNFEVVLTLTKDQLHKSLLWDTSLDKNTTFLGYISKDEIRKQFKDNTILVSTSIIETLGLHVIEAIQNGILVIVPDELYSKSVYGKDVITYKLNNIESLVKKICDVALIDNQAIRDIIIKNQNYLSENEKKKHHSIIEIFDEILKGNNV